FLALFIIFLLLIIVWQFKEIKRKNEKEKKLRDLELKFKESELAILRNQMNPHFVFNALNSIQSYILQSDPETASGYVQRFSVLMRSSLEYTMDDWISLRKEIDFLANYLHVEKLRFPDRFSFKITHSEEIDPEEINIPPLLIQPLVENCVKHAFSPDENGGLIKVHFELEADKIRCTVEDNGIGIVKKKARSRIKHRSYGIEVVQNRLELLDDEESGQYLEYHDLGETEEEGTGTRVLVLIPIE
ncbi:MAG: histidine kinase, partial [Bacteroidia bacterium]|nr:histidine kinase [Bacteroidia bacterium]